ncbi:MAG: putative lipase [Candidatus Omnitrophica bacterium]|nr:putative lipase [Candidatus Omnitrophota bacterium]MBU1996822.1 putative lipase [Candidatus Omnitrophota bacterium]MBU4333174.1 putative lipase [Candidatus Omnitrophota bacterium]
MKRIIITFLLLTVLQGVSVFAEEPSFKKTKHTVFLIHGISGTKEHFGKMEQALSKVLNAKDPNVEYLVESLEFDTGNDEKNIYDFAKDINLQIIRVTAEGMFQKEDKISFVMHSEGGLIGSVWLFQSLLGNKGFSSSSIIEHIDSFITLGTPFWGSKSAEFGRNIDGFFNSLGIDLDVPFGTKELEDMSIGSDLINDFRMALVDSKHKDDIAYLKDNIRFLNIAAAAQVLDSFGIFASGGEKYEDDGAVLLPSARFDFLFSRSLFDSYEEGDRVSLTNTRVVEFAPCIIVNGMHRAPIPELMEFADIVYVPKACIDNEYCQHPTFQYVWKQLLGEEIVQEKVEQRNFKSFLIDLNVHLANKDSVFCEDIKIEFSQLDGSPIEGSNVKISSFFEPFSEGKSKSKKYHGQCRFYFTGNIEKKSAQGMHAVLMKVSGEGLRTRYVEVLLKESYSSYVDINLIALDML